MNLAETIIPKSDQMNSDDLIAGPKTITITKLSKGTPEQPVVIHYEGDNGHPYKPGKSMRRVLVAMWGGDGEKYAGRRLTLYCDPAVRFGGQQVGGIRISHASDISGPFTIALTETRGKKKPHTVEPLPASSAAPVADRATLEALGETKARQGTAILRDWWASVPASPVKTALAAEMLPAWKETAANATPSA
jgi:hypothetical protein